MKPHREFFNRLAQNWDSLIGEDTRARLKEILARLGLKPGSRVLDVGSGTGILSSLLQQVLGKEGEIVALDFAEEMLRRARNKGLQGSICQIQADVHALPLLSPFTNADAIKWATLKGSGIKLLVQLNSIIFFASWSFRPIN